MPFRELGYTEPAFEQAARLAHRLDSWAAMEAAATRRLGISAVERRFGLEPSVPVERATRATWLGRRPEPWTVELHLGYGITHTVFHLTDWGANPAGLPEDIAGYLACWLPAWTDDWREIGHWDLLGELLVVDACLPRPALDMRAWRAFAAAQAAAGAMPSGVPGAGPGGGGPLGPRERFDHLYQPTLVAAFASVLASSRALGALAPAAGR